jgi:hypothetical protein
MLAKYHQDLINNVSNKFRVDAKLVESIVSFNFKKTATLIKSRDAPDILLHGIGRFSVDISKIKRKLFAYYITCLNQEANNALKAITVDKLNVLHNIYIRKCKEKKYQTGQLSEQINIDLTNFINKLNEEERKKYDSKQKS